MVLSCVSDGVLTESVRSISNSGDERSRHWGTSMSSPFCPSVNSSDRMNGYKQSIGYSFGFDCHCSVPQLTQFYVFRQNQRRGLIRDVDGIAEQVERRVERRSIFCDGITRSPCNNTSNRMVDCKLSF